MYVLHEIARLTGTELNGDPNAEVQRAAPFDIAQEGDITYAENPSYLTRVEECKATAIIVPSGVDAPDKNLLITVKPRLAFARAIQLLHKKIYSGSGVSPDLIAGEGTVFGAELSISPRVTIGRECTIGDRVTLYPGVVIGDRCLIGDDSVLHANVSVYEDCEIGKRVIIHAGAVVGSDGFSFAPDEEGKQVKMLQLGRVRIEDDCEIGSNCAIDRGAFGDTILRRGVKLDNLIQVGHHCEIGEDTVVAALTGFSGGTRVGRKCVSAGQVGTNQHITIGDGAVITGQAGVTKNVKPGAVVGGTIPAQEINSWRRSQVIYSKLPELVERVRKLEEAAGLKAKK